MNVEQGKASSRVPADEQPLVEFFDWMIANGRGLTPTNRIPLYHQLADLLRSWITVVARPGTKIPTEQQLTESFEVSRATVQKALDLLSLEGLVSRARGRGTFVQAKRFDRALALRSLWDDLVEAGRDVSTKVITRTVGNASGEAGMRLRLQGQGRLIVLVRLREADGSPFALLRNWLPLPHCEAVLDADLTQVSLYSVIEETCGLPLLEAEESIGARRPIPSEVEHLRLSKDEPVLYMRRHTFTSEGKPVEWADHAYPASKTRFYTRVPSGIVKAKLLSTRGSGGLP